MLQRNKNASQLGTTNYELKKCVEHRKASSYGMPLNFKQKCQCCNKYSAKQSLTANFSPLKIYYSGSQVPSFLVLIKSFGILFAILSVCFTVPLTIVNYSGSGCKNVVNCTDSFLLKISVFNSFNQAWRLYTISYVSILLFILYIASLLLIRKATKSIKRQIDEVDLFPSSYSVYLKLPEGYGNEHTILNEIEKWWKRQLKSSKDQMEILFPELYDKNENDQEPKQAKKLREQQPKNEFKVKKRNSKSKVLEDILFFYKQKNQSPIKRNKLRQNDKEVQMDNFHRRKTQIEPQQEIKQFNDSKFCLLIFKKKQYTDYFMKKASPCILQKILFFSKFRQFCLSKKEAKVQQDVYPSQIFWQNQPLSKSKHLKSQFLSYLFILLSFICNSAAFGGISYHLNYSASDQDGDLDQDNIPFIKNYFYVLTSFCINGITYFFNKLIYHFSKNQKHYTYSHKQTSLIIKTLFNNISTMFFMPFITIKLMGNKFLWIDNGFLQTSNCTLLIYMVFYLFQKYISISSLSSIYNYYKMNQTQTYTQKQANSKYQKPNLNIEEKYSTILTVIFVSFMNIPFNPSVLILTTLWFFIEFWLQKISIAYFYCEDQYHGSTLTLSIIKIAELFFIPLIISTFSVFCVCVQFNPIQDITVVIVIQGILMIFGIFFTSSPTSKLSELVFTCKKSQDSLDDAIKTQSEYKNVVERFLSFYEKYQNAYIWQLKSKCGYKSRESTNISENVKHEMKQIEKSLTQSLKQQLINHKMAILEKKQAPQDHQDYYEYQRKVQMRKTLPKVPIPSLLQKAPLLFNHSETVKQFLQQVPQGQKNRKNTLLKPKVRRLDRER